MQATQRTNRRMQPTHTEVETKLKNADTTEFNWVTKESTLRY